MKRSHPAFSFIVVAALVLGACSSGESSNGDPTVPIPTAGTSPISTTASRQHAVDRACDRRRRTSTSGHRPSSQPRRRQRRAGHRPP